MAVRIHCQRISDARKSVPDQRGFTLFEILVVLFIIGLGAAVVIPQLPRMADRVDFALKRESFELSLSGLAYQAFNDNEDLVLSGLYDETGSVEETTEPRTPIPRRSIAQGIAPSEAIDLPPIVVAKAKVTLPTGWRLDVPDPIYFRVTGFCKGGTVNLIIGDLRYSYLLQPPLCQPIPTP